MSEYGGLPSKIDPEEEFDGAEFLVETMSWKRLTISSVLSHVRGSSHSSVADTLGVWLGY